MKSERSNCVKEGEKRMLKMKCSEVQVKLAMEDEKLSMIVAGKSRMGKTYFLSLLANTLMEQGSSVHLIDLGAKWSFADKQKMIDSGATTRCPGKDEITLVFYSKKDLLGLSQCICNALGFRSVYAKSACKSAILNQISKDQSGFCMKDFVKTLAISAEENEWSAKLFERFDCCGEIPEIKFEINEAKAREMNDTSTIWDLLYIEESLVQLVAYLILYGVLCVQKKRFRDGNLDKKIFVIIDEFQNFDLSQRSMIDICLTEGQKYKMYLILATQFLQGKFSDAVNNQLMQCGFQIYFRLLDVDAHHICSQIARDSRENNILYKKLINLPRGQCLFIGCHTLGSNEHILESARFIKIENVDQ